MVVGDCPTRPGLALGCTRVGFRDGSGAAAGLLEAVIAFGFED